MTLNPDANSDPPNPISNLAVEMSFPHSLGGCQQDECGVYLSTDLYDEATSERSWRVSL